MKKFDRILASAGDVILVGTAVTLAMIVLQSMFHQNRTNTILDKIQCLCYYVLQHRRFHLVLQNFDKEIVMSRYGIGSDVKHIRWNHGKKSSTVSTGKRIFLTGLGMLAIVATMSVCGKMYFDIPIVSISQRTGECVRAVGPSGKKIPCATAMKKKYIPEYVYQRLLVKVVKTTITLQDRIIHLFE